MQMKVGELPHQGRELISKAVQEALHSLWAACQGMGPNDMMSVGPSTHELCKSLTLSHQLMHRSHILSRCLVESVEGLEAHSQDSFELSSAYKDRLARWARLSKDASAHW